MAAAARPYAMPVSYTHLKETKDAELEKDENFVKAIAVLEDPAATQSEIDAAYQALTGQGGGGPGDGGGSAITTQPSVTRCV